MSAGGNLWNRVRGLWSAQAEQLTYAFLPHDDADPLVPYDSYLRLWLSDLFLADQRAWAADVYPSLRASVRLDFAGSAGVVFSTMVTPASGQEAPALRSGRLTELLPFCGGTVGLQACLYAVKGDDWLRLAIDVVSGFSSLAVPPLAAAAAVADKVAVGIDKVEAALADAGQGPVLVLDKEYAAVGAASDRLVPGYVVLAGPAPTRLDPSLLSVVDGRAHHGGELLTGVDYMVFEIQGVRERDDWRFPEWDRMLFAAKEARVRGEQVRFDRIRTDLLAAAATSPDLTPVDARRVAALIRDDLDAVGYGMAGDGSEWTVADLVETRGLPSADAVGGLTVADLLTIGA